MTDYYFHHLPEPIAVRHPLLPVTQAPAAAPWPARMPDEAPTFYDLTDTSHGCMAENCADHCQICHVDECDNCEVQAGPHPLPGQVLRRTTFGNYNEITSEDAEAADNIQAANIITSEVVGSEMHRPVLDIDMPVKLIPSSTEGHFHLLIDKEVSWDDYMRLLWVMADIGIVEEGYASASQERGYTAVRLPWVKK